MYSHENTHISFPPASHPCSSKEEEEDEDEEKKIFPPYSGKTMGQRLTKNKEIEDQGDSFRTEELTVNVTNLQRQQSGNNGKLLIWKKN